jgi:transposase
VLFPRCAGLYVHKKVVVACVRIVEESKVRCIVRSFDTTTPSLLLLSEFLSDHEVTHVALEATGMYWKPVWHVLSGHFELVLANAAHIKNVPGRKSDVNDATWIAELLAHGLIRSSFVPPPEIQDLRALTRTRKQLVREIAQHTLRIQKTLEDANLKLDNVVTDILGMTGRRILEALVRGESDPETLSNLACGSLKKARAALQEALVGHIRPCHRFLLGQHLRLIDDLSLSLKAIDQEVGDRLRPFEQAAALLETIPGVGKVVAQVILAEVGVDMSRFPDAGHLRSWAGLCPRLDQSAGKRRCTRMRKGAPWLKTTLIQAAWCAVRTKGCYLRALYGRLKGKRGSKKAIGAVAASMMTAVYYMLRDGLPYNELGQEFFDRRDTHKTVVRLVRRLEQLANVKVRLEAVTDAPCAA